LLDLLPERMKERNRVEWNRQGERVEAVSALLYDELVVEETRGAMPEPEEAARVLAEKALEAGLHRFAEVETVEGLLARIRFAAGHFPMEEPSVERALRELSYGLRSFAELREATREGGLERALLGQLSGEAQRALERLAPERLRLPSGRMAKVRYVEGQTPSVASRLQDFFGLSETPRVAGGAVALVVHLLAPSQRPVQTTQDLAGFWERLYPQLRRELGRRYPRHAWPENPYNAFKD